MSDSDAEFAFVHFIDAGLKHHVLVLTWHYHSIDGLNALMMLRFWREAVPREIVRSDFILSAEADGGPRGDPSRIFSSFAVATSPVNPNLLFMDSNGGCLTYAAINYQTLIRKAGVLKRY